MTHSRQLTEAWTQQRIWSQAANRLKERIDRARLATLILGIATAALAVAADQVGGPWPTAGRVIAAAAAVTAGVATVLQRRVTTERIRNWTRARSASEGLKTEIHSYLGGGAAYTGADRDRRLGTQARTILQAVNDLGRHTVGVKSDDNPVPDIRDADSYIEQRVNNQIDWYKQRAARYENRVDRLRTAGDILGIAAVVLAAVATASQVNLLTAWVSVLTTIGASIIAHVSAARYDHLIIEYLRTAQRLAHLRDEFLDTPDADRAAFVDASEAAISVENQGWMARWDQPEPTR